MLILVFMVPFYIGYFVVSNIRLCEYLVYGSVASNFSERCVGRYAHSSLLPLALFWLDNFSLELNALALTLIEQVGDTLPQQI